MHITTMSDFIRNLNGAGSTHKGLNCFCQKSIGLSASVFSLDFRLKNIAIEGRVQNIVFSPTDLTLKIYLGINPDCTEGFQIKYIQIKVDKESRFHHIFEIELIVEESNSTINYSVQDFSISFY
jgi:hypothetical protein